MVEPPSSTGSKGGSIPTGSGGTTGTARDPEPEIVAPQKQDGVYQVGDKVIVTKNGQSKPEIVFEVMGDYVATLSMRGNSMPNIVKVSDIEHWTEESGIPEPPDMDEWDGQFQEGAVVVGKRLDNGERVGVMVTSSVEGRDYYEGIDEKGVVHKIRRKGATFFSSSYGLPKVAREGLQSAFDEYQKKANQAVKMTSLDADQAALDYKPGETVTNDLVIKEMKGKYKVTPEVLMDSEKISKVLNKFNQVNLRLGSSRPIRIDDTYVFDLAMKKKNPHFYKHLRNAYGVNVKYPSSGQQKIGLDIYTSNAIREAVDYASKGKELDTKMHKREAAEHIGTLVHESIHAWHPVNEGNRLTKLVQINEGMTEWLAMQKVRTFIKATDLEVAFGDYLEDPELYQNNSAYQMYVTHVSDLARLLESKGHNSVELLLRVHKSGFRKNWSLVAKAVGRPETVVRKVIEAAFKQRDPEYIFDTLTVTTRGKN